MPASTTRTWCRALGINVAVVFGITFFVGAFLAGWGLDGGVFAGVAPERTDGQWLLNSLIVVIIGGLGSVKGAAFGVAAATAWSTAFSPAYLPSDYTFYSIIFTFVLVAIGVRPARGPLRRPHDGESERLHDRARRWCWVSSSR